jgi:hypothetical protein
MQTGTAQLKLHHGPCPPWLFRRMRLLAREIARLLVEEEGAAGLMRRLSDPFWFQALGCVLGFDWHSSGVTTTTCGALKEGLKSLEAELGLFVAGGKGAASRQTPAEIERWGDLLDVEPGELVRLSRLAAKVDNTAVQDGYQIYHHVFIFDRAGHWAVVQQGMNEASGHARRYHWLGEIVADPVDEPHAAVCCDRTGPSLNLVAHESAAARAVATTLAGQPPDQVIAEFRRVRHLEMPDRHAVWTADIAPDRLASILLPTYENPPADFADLLSRRGIGPATIRALSLLAELVYGTPASIRDPARFAFAHGGKDGYPFPVDRSTYDRSIDTLKAVLDRARVGDREKLDAFRRLAVFTTGREEPYRSYRPAPERPPPMDPRTPQVAQPPRQLSLWSKRGLDEPRR